MYLGKIQEFKPYVWDTFWFFVAMMAAFGFPLSARYNSLYGPVSLCAIIASMAFTKSCTEAASKLFALRVDDKAEGIVDVRSLHLPTSQWALGMIGGLGHDAMEAACRAAFRACTALARARGMIPERPLGMIDGQSSAYYGEKGDEKYITRGKSKDGTTKFHTFLCSVIRAGQYPLHTAMCRMCPGVPLEEYLRDVLAQNREAGIMCSHWLVDRLFFSVAAMYEFGRVDEYFLMYARATPGIKKALDEYLSGKREAMSEYVVRSGRRKFTGTLAFVEKTRTKKNGERETVILPIFSNLPRAQLAAAIRDLPIELKKRWIQESSFRVAKFSKPMTTSNSPSHRTLFFGMSLLIQNLWVITNHAIGARSHAECGEVPVPEPPADDRLGDRRCLASKTKYSMTSKEFLSLLVSKAAELHTKDKRTQDAHTAWAVAKNAHLIQPPVLERPILTGEYASGIPRWA